MEPTQLERPWGPMQVWSSAAPAGSGPIVSILALHGLGGSGRYWDGLVERLEEPFGAAPDEVSVRFRVVAPDLAGFGGSSIDNGDIDLTRDFHLRDLDAVMESFAPDGPVVVAGHSMGGILAGLWAARHPERVAGLAVIAAPEPGGDDLDFRQRFEGDHPSFPRTALPVVVAAWPALAPAIAALRGLPLPVVRDFANQSFRGRVWTLWSVVSEPAVLQELAPLTDLADRAPSLLLYAAEDKAIHADAQEKWSARMPSAEYRRITGTGHQLLIQTRFAPLVTWLRSLEAVAMK